MIHPSAVAGFLAALLPMTVTPGASLTLLVRHVAADGRRRAIPVIAGTATGLYVHATLALGGLSAMVMRSSQAFTVVKMVGAAYLIGLGIWTLRTSRPGPLPVRIGGSAFGQSLLGNVLNPKAASVYLTLMPQFVDPSLPLAGQILVLATAHAVMLTVWLLIWTVMVGRAAPRARTIFNKITGVVLIGLGLRAGVT